MVSRQRPPFDPGQPGPRDPGFHSLVHYSYKSPQRNPIREPADKCVPLHRLKCCGLGCAHGQTDRLWDVVCCHERYAHQCAGTACWLGLQAFEDTLQDSNVAIMCVNVSAIAYLRNQGGTRIQDMCRMTIDTCEWAEKTVQDTDTQTSPWASQYASRSSELQRSDSEIRVESESSRSTACIPSLGQSSSGSVCTPVQCQTRNIQVQFPNRRLGK